MKRQDELNEAWCKYMGKCSTEIMQALAFALRWTDAHPHWISVEEELPKNRELVFITDCEFTDMGFYDYTDDAWQPCEKWLGDITHWMPLPQAPLVTDLNKKDLPPVSCQEGDILVTEEGGEE